MSVVTIRGRYRNVAMLAFKKVFLFFISTVIAIAMFSLVDDDGYLFLLQKNTQLGSMVSTMITTVTDTLGITTSGGGGNGKVGASGLNKLMVAKMQAGYAKDYLSICLENEEGKLDTTKREIYAPLESIVGINAAETNFYKSGKGAYILPTSAIPADQVYNGYGTGDVSLYKWCSKNTINPSLPACGGAFAFTPGTGKAGDGWTGISTKSVYNKGTSTPKGIGDGYLMPDAVCGVNGFCMKAVNELNVPAKKLAASSNYAKIIAFCTAYDHNVGSGVQGSLYGTVSFTASSYAEPKDTDETLERFNILFSDIENVISKVPDKNINEFLKQMDATAEWIASELVLIHEGWSVTPEMAENLSGYLSRGVKIWNWFFPDEKVDNNSLKSKINAAEKTVSQLTGYSTNECNKYYGTSSGSYCEAIYNYDSSMKSQRTYGVAMKVISGTTTGLKNGKGTKRLIAFQGIPLQHGFVAAAFGEKIAARMMIYAGVNEADVFLTTGDSGEDTAGGGSGGTFTTNSKVLDELKAHGCDTKKLTQNRYLVLKAAMQMDGKTYQTPPSCGNVTCGNLNHPTYDCTSFVAHAVAGSGIKDIKKIMKEKGFPGWSGAYPTNKSSGLLVYHPFSGDTSVLKPGDILHHTAAEVGRSYGHAVIFVGMKNGKMCTLEAMGRRYGVGFFPNNRAQSGHDYSHDHRYFSLTVYEDVN